jgi:hypothetical protein
MSVPIEFAAQLVQDILPKFTMGSKKHALIPLIVMLVPLLAYFVWLYYREWKLKRNFRRYWAGKSRKSTD